MVGGLPKAGREPWAPRWLRRLVGDEYFREVAWVRLSDDDTTGKPTNLDVLPYLGHFPRLKYLSLNKIQTTEQNLKCFRDLTNLETLHLLGAHELTDTGAVPLRELKNLRSLYISYSKMTDSGLFVLSNLQKLEDLTLDENDFTDRGMESIKG